MSYKIRRKLGEFGWRLKAKRISNEGLRFEEPIGCVIDEDTDQGLSLEAYDWDGSRPR